MLLLSRRIFRKTWEWSIRQSFCLLWSVKKWYVVCIQIGNIFYFCSSTFKWIRFAQESFWWQLRWFSSSTGIICITVDTIHPSSSYTAGFILQRLFVAKTEKWSFRYWFTTFTESSTMLLDDAIDEGLPTSIIEHYQLNDLFCPNQRFFSFHLNYWSKLYFKFHVGNDDCIWWRISHWWDQQCIERR